ncbi:MAG TPA: helix-turn-helix domain-containing protein [Steroidobacteraceae bacterium]|jgi:AcrR family transcriptional regulator|nr:helix-turn-helix domain-containing protein [Steroidobacteraceae bacterium]
MTEFESAPRTPRALKKGRLRDRILDELIALMVAGAADLSHDALARRVGVGRRTLYRYFPDRETLMEAALMRVRSVAGPQVVLPRSVDELLATLEPIYTGFDRIAPVATMIRSTPQGRALRLSQNRRRIERYTAALADAVKALPRQDRRLATAMIQVLHTTPWLEMRDHWGLDGRQIARVTGWAIRTLLADLKARGALPLDRAPAAHVSAAAT